MQPIKDYEGKYYITQQGDVVNAKGKTLAYTVNKQTGYKQVSLWKNNKGSSKAIHRLVALTYLTNPNNLPEVNHIDGNKLNNHVDNLEWVTRSENMIHAYSIGLVEQAKLLDAPTYESLLERFLLGESMTALASEHSAGLTRVTINMRKLAKDKGIHEKFEAQLKEQQRIRNAKANAAKQQAKRQEVAQYALDGELVAVYISLTSASKALGKSTTGPISNATRGITKTAYGFKWELVDTALNDYRKDKVEA